jgi:thiamine-phosphate pyrophosphorylase
MIGGEEGSDPSADARLDLARDIVALARPYAACVLVNGDVAAAREAGADGVHLPQGHPVAPARAALGPAALVGVSAHDEAEAVTAARSGADYVAISPVFASISKPGYGPGVGLEGLAEIAAQLAIPVVALGGVDAGNAARCLAAGARAVAVLGAVMAASNPCAATARIVEALRAPGPVGRGKR